MATEQPSFDALSRGIIEAHKAGDTASAQRMAEIQQQLYPDGKVEVTPVEQVNQAQFASEDLGDVETAAEQITQTTRPVNYILATGEPGEVVTENPNGIRSYVNQEARIVSEDPGVIEAALAYFEGASDLNPVELHKRVEAKKGMSTKDKFLGGVGNLLEGTLGTGSRVDETLGKVTDGVNFLYQQANRSFPYTQGLLADGNMSPDNNLIQTGDEAKAQYKETDAQFDEAYPGISMAANLTGAIGSGVALGTTKTAQKLYSWISKLPTWQKIAYGTGIGGTTGLLEGILYGSGLDESDNNKSSYQNAKDMGTLGIATGAGGNLMALPFIAGWIRIRHGLKDNSVKEISEIMGVDIPAAQVMRTVLDDTGATLEEMTDRLAKAGKDGMIADADKAMEVITDAVATAGGGSASTIARNVEDRTTSAFKDLNKSMDDNIAKLPVIKGTNPPLKADAFELARAAAEKSAPARTKAYNKSYEFQVDYLSDGGKQVTELLDEIEPSMMTTLLSRINGSIKKSTGDTTQLSLKRSLNIEGKEVIELAELPTMKQLDFIKRELSDIAYNSPGVMKQGQILPVASRDASTAIGLRYRLSELLKGMNPAYREAVKLGQDKITRENALDVGGRMLRGDVTPQQVRLLMKDAGEAEKEMARYGLRSNLDQMITRIKGSPNRQMDSKQLDVLFKELSSEDNRLIIQSVLGNKELKKLVKMLDRAETAINFKAVVAENSKTGIRLQTNQTINEAAAQPVRDAMGEAQPFVATREILKKINQSRLFTAKRKNMIMKDLANAMTGQKGTAAIAQLKQVYKAVKDGNTTLADIEYLSNFLATGLNAFPQTFIMGTAREVQQYNED